MHDVPDVKADCQLAAPLDRVERGEQVVITRHGRRVARMIPDAPRQNRAIVRSAG